MKGQSKKTSAAKVEKTRSGFRSLISANPNYFGNTPTGGFKVIKKIASNTNYEEVTSVGYNPVLRRLFATFELKRESGYLGDLCDDGSNEYVRFYVDFGTGWQDAGLVATDVHDISSEKDCANKKQHPLSYSVELPYAPSRKWCTSPQLPRVRAILSWNAQPPAGTPNFSPVYGNVKECAIQIGKGWLFKHFVNVLSDNKNLIASAKPILSQLDPEFPEIPDLPEPPYPGSPTFIESKEAEIDELIATYSYKSKGGGKKFAVEPHRFAFSAIKSIQDNSLNDAIAISNLSQLLKKVKVNIDDLVIAIEDTTGNINFEELVDLGLDGNREKLVATYHVKKQSGFSGNLCSNGSTEHVSFWADWNDTCEWEYLDTVSIKAYDFDDLPDGGLCYTAALPVDLDEFKRKCKNPKIARVRAVLSWNSPPSVTNASTLPTWGNRLDAHVLLPRKEGQPGKLKVVGGLSTEFINDATGMASSSARFVDTGTLVYSPLGLSCPFGGLIVVRGPAVNNKRYRIQVIDSASVSQTLSEKIWVTPNVGFSNYHTSDADGWFNYLPYQSNFAGILGYYRSNGEGLVTIELEIEGEGVVDTQTVQLDNTKPDISISITEPGSDCSLFDVGTLIKGNVIATDVHMGAWSVVIDGGPAGFGPVTATTGGSGNADTPALGAEWTFDSKGLEQCGYVVRVHANDRAIVNSGNHQHRDNDDVGFCLLE